MERLRSKKSVMKIIKTNAIYFLISVVGLLLTFALSACAPNMGNGSMIIAPIRMPFSLLGDAGRLFKSTGVDAVRVTRFSDERPLDGIGEIDDRILVAATDVGDAARGAFVEAVKSRRVLVKQDMNIPTLGGEVERWFVKIEPGFPTTSCIAMAKIKVEVFDKSGVIVYQGHYEGGYSETRLVPRKQDVEDVLQRAMANAVQSAVDDSELWRVVEAVDSV
jgi:hypothetical protein